MLCFDMPCLFDQSLKRTLGAAYVCDNRRALRDGSMRVEGTRDEHAIGHCLADGKTFEPDM